MLKAFHKAYARGVALIRLVDVIRLAQFAVKRRQNSAERLIGESAPLRGLFQPYAELGMFLAQPMHLGASDELPVMREQRKQQHVAALQLRHESAEHFASDLLTLKRLGILIARDLRVKLAGIVAQILHIKGLDYQPLRFKPHISSSMDRKAKSRRSIR